MLKRRDLLVALGAGTAVLAGCRVPGRKATGLPESRTREATQQWMQLSAESPDAAIRGELLVDPTFEAAPRWRVTHRGRTVLDYGSLYLVLSNGRQLGPGARFVRQRLRTRDDTWKPPYGLSSEYRGECSELTLELHDSAIGVKLEIVLRVYNAGVAVRYIIREAAGGGRLALSSENTEFALPSDARIYASRDEGEYQVTAPRHVAPIPHPDLTASSDAGPLADIPLTASLANGLTVVIAESDRLHYPRLMLRTKEGEDVLVSHLMRFPGRADGWSGPGETPAEGSFSLSAPFSTPWRVVLVGERPGAVVENAGLIPTLATQCRLADTRWIRPGRAFRSFRDNTTAAGLACADFAERRSLEYIEFDARWYGDGTDPSDATAPVAGLDIRRVIEYCRSKSVGVILYVDRVPAMRQLDDILRTYRGWGVAGIKFGFMWEGRQSDNDWLYETIRKCGEHQLLVCVHDNARPAGLERTLPNYVSLEGVRGNEQFPTARHNVTLPFTANVAGPIDYTICYAQARNQTTNAHQLAMAVVYYCPLTFLYWYDKPARYADAEWPEMDWFDQCPTVWDETRVIDGKIGEYVAIARRSGERWFIGVMTNEAPRTLRLPLNFLGDGRWHASVFSDGNSAAVPGEARVEVHRTVVTSNTTCEVVMAPSGGHAIRLERLAQVSS